MKLLLDTHSYLWATTDPAKLSAKVIALLENKQNQVFVSAVSAWELAIKVNLGKLSLRKPVEELFTKELILDGFDLLTIAISHIGAVATLPLHHRDPFDRLLVAQAMIERLPIVSYDAKLDFYPVTRLW